MRLIAVDGVEADGASVVSMSGVGANPDVVYVADAMAPRALAEVVRAVRHRWQDTFVIASFTDTAALAIPTLLQGGADDIIRSPCPIEELRARLTAPRRLRSKLTRVSPQDWSDAPQVTKLQAWQDAAAVLRDELSTFIGVQTTIAECPRSWGPISTEIQLSIPRDAVEIVMRLCVSEATSASLCSQMLGLSEATSDVVDDLMKEMANTLGGAFMRCAQREGVDLTLGLPRVSSASETKAHQFEQTLCLSDGGAVDVAVQLAVHARESTQVLASALCEGMVLATELRGPGGALLAASGTRLTATTAMRLAAHLGPRSLVTVLPAGDA